MKKPALAVIFSVIMIFSAVGGQTVCGSVNEDEIVFFGDSTTAHMSSRRNSREQSVDGKGEYGAFQNSVRGEAHIF